MERWSAVYFRTPPLHYSMYSITPFLQPLQGFDVAEDRLWAVGGGGPAGGVGDDAEDVLVVVGGIGLVAGAEVEDLAPPAVVAAAAAEDLAAREPADEDEVVRRGDV